MIAEACVQLMLAGRARTTRRRVWRRACEGRGQGEEVRSSSSSGGGASAPRRTGVAPGWRGRRVQQRGAMGLPPNLVNLLESRSSHRSTKVAVNGRTGDAIHMVRASGKGTSSPRSSSRSSSRNGIQNATRLAPRFTTSPAHEHCAAAAPPHSVGHEPQNGPVRAGGWRAAARASCASGSVLARF